MSPFFFSSFLPPFLSLSLLFKDFETLKKELHPYTDLLVFQGSFFWRENTPLDVCILFCWKFNFISLSYIISTLYTQIIDFNWFENAVLLTMCSCRTCESSVYQGAAALNLINIGISRVQHLHNEGFSKLSLWFLYDDWQIPIWNPLKSTSRLI